MLLTNILCFLGCSLLRWLWSMFDETDMPFSFSIAFYVNSWWGTTATTSIFIAAAITDWLDGYIARKVSNVVFFKL